MKKWSEEEFNLSVNYINDGLTYDEISGLLNRTKKSVRIKLNKFGVYVKPKIYSTEKKCFHCNETFVSLISEDRKYCSQSCAAKENNKLYIKRPKIGLNNIESIDNCGVVKKCRNNCLNCGVEVDNSSKTYCNQICFHENRKKQYHFLIESGVITLPSRQYKNYLIEKYGNKCMECGWYSINLTSNRIPIELEHIDGNSENNSLNNLKLLCPNCHSLTPTYKALNKGNGRHNRRERYQDGKSY
jgi:hypothetical protein